ncbi:MAG: NUDIX hydrolase [Actinomycetaceae bacterium]|nr:NUDIX hydrolase [Arcanobacterium sp.]MDD7505472.1 NUDIX hydrolase [Actinomycetaceae bacterium]
MANGDGLRPRELTKADPKADVYAAGAVVWRLGRKGLEVFVIHRPRYPDWSFPKGKMKPRESLRGCALREVEEETGLAVVLGRPLGWVAYKLSDGRRKAVHYWAAREVSRSMPYTNARKAVKRAPKQEVDSGKWVALGKAQVLLTARSDRQLAKRIAAWHDSEQLATEPLIVLRHGKAVKREQWKHGKGAERRRPLTARGKHQADALAVELSAYGIEHLATSPWKRCLDTVKPYARKARCDISLVEAFTERNYKITPSRLESIVEDAVNEKEGVVVRSAALALCVHRPTLAQIVKTMEKLSPSSVQETLPKRDPWLKTAEYLVVHRARNASGSAKSRAKIVDIERVGQVA